MLPREKMISLGAKELSDDELLAIMLGVGSGNESVFDMAKRLKEEYSLSKLFHMSYEELSKIPGIKEAKACKLMAVFEIVRRILKEEGSKETITTSKDLYDYVYSDYLDLNKELLTVVYVDSSLRIMKKESYSENEYDSVRFPIKRIALNMITLDAYGIFLAHNHPTGRAYPSESDNQVTKNISLAVSGMGMHLFDHIIIAGDTYYSYTDQMK